MKFLLWIPMFFLVAGCMSISDFSETVGSGENEVSKRQLSDELQVTLDATAELPPSERQAALESAARSYLDRIGTTPDAGYLLAEGLDRARLADDPSAALADHYEVVDDHWAPKAGFDPADVEPGSWTVMVRNASASASDAGGNSRRSLRSWERSPKAFRRPAPPAAWRTA